MLKCILEVILRDPRVKDRGKTARQTVKEKWRKRGYDALRVKRERGWDEWQKRAKT